MLVTEEITIGSKRYIHNYSDAGFYIQKVGTEEFYEDAIDALDTGYNYVETDKKIKEEIEDAD